MTAVVKQDDVAAGVKPSRNLGFDHACRRRIPVVTSYIPHHGFKAEFASHAQRYWTPSAERRTKQVGVCADCVFQYLMALRQLDAGLCGGLEDKQRVRESVIADRVSAGGDGAGNLGRSRTKRPIMKKVALTSCRARTSNKSCV